MLGSSRNGEKQQLCEMFVPRAGMQTFSHSQAFKSWWSNFLLVCSTVGRPQGGQSAALGIGLCDLNLA